MPGPARSVGITLDLPLLCRRLLARRGECDDERALSRLLVSLLAEQPGVLRVGVFLPRPGLAAVVLASSRGFRAKERSAALHGELAPEVREVLGNGNSLLLEGDALRAGGRHERARLLAPLRFMDEVLGVLELGVRDPSLLAGDAAPWIEHACGLVGSFLREMDQARLLQRQEIELRSITCSASDAIILADERGRVTFWNWAAENLFGYSQGEALGRDIHELLAPADYADAYLEGMRRFRRSGEGVKIGQVVELLACRNDGVEIPVEISVTAIDGADGPMVVGIVRDISQRWQTEQELRASEARYRAIVEDQAELICRYDPIGTLSFVNDAYCRYFGSQRDELLGRPFMLYIPDEDQVEVERQLAALGADQPVARVEHRVVLPDGRVRWLQWTDRAVFDEDGQVKEYQAVGRDVTDQRQAELGLRRAREELEQRVIERTAELVRANERMAREVGERRRAERALIRHQATLRSMSSQLSLAEERERRRIATAVHDNIGQCLALSRMKLAAVHARAPEHAPPLREIAGLLDDAIANTRTLTFELSTPILYDLGFVAAVEWLCELTEQQHGLRFVLEAPKRPLELETDMRVLLFRAVRELLHNILKHAQASTVWIRVRKARGFVRLAVEDDGVGFPEPLPDAASGAGFGLFAIRERVTALGGTFRMGRRAGGGARVQQSIPLASLNQDHEEST